jgi:uncharacterized membrane protein
MNQAHYHLVLNHLPIIFPLVGIVLLLISIFFKSEAVKKSAYFIFIVGALSTIPAFSTGEGAEEIVENIAGVTESLIHNHEEIAEIFATLAYILGSLALLGIYLSQKAVKFSNIFSYLVLLFSLVVLLYAQKVGTTGGEIRHTEIRTGSTTLLQEGNDENIKGKDSEEKEED